MKPKFNSVPLFAVLLLSLALAGCPAVSLVRLDNEWARTYQARSEAQKNPQDVIVGASSFDAQLADISDRAAADGDKKTQSDAPMAIGLYRVAILSAWKSRELRENKVPELSRKGSAACDKLPNKDASQPRDCALFKIVPPLAWHDQKARFVSSVSRKDQARLTQQDKDQIPVVYKDLVAAFRDAGRARGEVLNLPLPNEFNDYVSAQWNAMYCTINGLTGVAAGQGLEGDMGKINRGMTEELKQAGAWKGC